MNVEKTFKNLVGREMTAEEKTRYLKFQKEFEIPDSDSIWMLFVWFEFYQRVFEKLPDLAKQKAELVAQSLREASQSVIDATKMEVDRIKISMKAELQKQEAEAKAHLASQGREILSSIQHEVGRMGSKAHSTIHEILLSELPPTLTRMRDDYRGSIAKKWVISLVLAIFFGLGGGAWGIWSFFQYAKNVGITETSISLSGSNDFVHFMKCDRPGWKKELQRANKTKYSVCMPGAGSGGWVIPQ